MPELSALLPRRARKEASGLQEDGHLGYWGTVVRGILRERQFTVAKGGAVVSHTEITERKRGGAGSPAGPSGARALLARLDDRRAGGLAGPRAEPTADRRSCQRPGCAALAGGDPARSRRGPEHPVGYRRRQQACGGSDPAPTRPAPKGRSPAQRPRPQRLDPGRGQAPEQRCDHSQHRGQAGARPESAVRGAGMLFSCSRSSSISSSTRWRRWPRALRTGA